MIELRDNGKGGWEVPGEPVRGRVYKVVNLKTGQIGYNYTITDLEQIPAATAAMIEGYDTFVEWVTDMIPVDDVYTEVKRLNQEATKNKLRIPTKFTKRLDDIRYRMKTGQVAIINGHSTLDDIHWLLDQLRSTGDAVWRE